MAKDDGSAEADARARPKRKTKKKRAPRSRAAKATPSDRPGFAARYPRDERLDELLDAFAAGNYAFVRVEAPNVADATDDDDVKLAALDLRRRIEPPTTAKFLWGLAMALLGFLFSFYLSHGH